ncbi:MAG: chemotaxis-specific protein-glutamate methyltransferase CheB [Nitrospirae bacterium]|nr:chemotaxis-specific protein-glutamate methyltransferase CheB [Nitrospirota bacterium]
MGQIRIVVVDDSVVARELIVAILSTDKDILVVGEAGNGRDAVEKVRDLKPDIVTMDVEMPVMNGLDAIELIMASHPVPILVVTTLGDARTAYAAISRGALDLVIKPDINIEAAQEFIDKIKLLSKIRVITHIGGNRTAKETKVQDLPVFDGNPLDSIVAIASSTGGPEAISVILSGLPEKFPCPVVIAQHISDGFVSGMVEWLKGISKLDIKVASNGDCLAAGTVYVSPSDRHMEVSPERRISLIDRHPKDIYRPSCDVLLSSVARVYGRKSIGVILTGMGSDGALGMKRIKDAKGTTIAQDEKTSVVFGMNKVTIDSGCVDKILPLDKIANEVAHLAGKKQKAALG